VGSRWIVTVEELVFWGMKDFWWFMYDFITPHLTVATNLHEPTASYTVANFPTKWKLKGEASWH
jgi:hypothetical protein